jgi:hypothetical protein
MLFPSRTRDDFVSRRSCPDKATNHLWRSKKREAWLTRAAAGCPLERFFLRFHFPSRLFSVDYGTFSWAQALQQQSASE